MFDITQWKYYATIGAVVFCLNAVLSGISVALDFIKDKTPTDLDNKAAAFVHKLIDLLKKLVDLIGMNPQH